MHTLNGSCQTTTPSTSSVNNSSQQQQNGSGSDSNNNTESLHPLTYNNNNNHHSTMHYNSLKNSDKNLLNGHQNNHQTQSFTPGQRDILRLIGQHLRYLGLSKTTESLINESGCMLEHPSATNFCNLIMNGEWDKAERALNDLRNLMDSNADITKMKFLILEQKYLECLEDGKVFEALKCLRDELAPLKYNTDRLHELSCFLMCPSEEDLKRLSKWEGKTEASRQKLMDKLQIFLPPNVMLPPRRLESLILQAIDSQYEKCPFHNNKDKYSIDSLSLLKDHVCSKEQFPSTTLQVLTDHCDEIWFCKFSNDGLKLATGSKDGTLIIWDVNPLTLKVTLNKSYDEHTCGVGWISWSPDDRYVIVCGTEECTELWIWDIEQKVLKKRLNHSHDDSLTSAAWMSDGQHFVCGGLKGQFYYCDLDGNVKDTWEGVRIRCLQCLPDGMVLAADSLKRIRQYNFKDINDSHLIQEDFQIMSFTLNKQTNLALISVATQGIHLWDLKDCVLVRRYQGAIQNNYMSFCSFGGVDENFIASGSEDNRVYIWHIKKEKAIAILEGHTRNVNCVSWNPVIHGLVASASDDGTIRLWGPSQYANDTSIINNNNNNITNDNIASNIINDSLTTNRSDRSTPV